MSAAIVMYSAGWCFYCERAKALLRNKGAPFVEIDVDGTPGARATMVARSGRSSVPQIFIGDRHVGGCDDLYELDARGELDGLLSARSSA